MAKAKVKNKYCSQNDFHNEADIEQVFVRRLLEDFGFSDSDIRPKNALSQLTVGGMRGSGYERYRPDFAIKLGTKIVTIIEVKAPTENLKNHFWQPAAYTRLINGEYRGSNPVKFFILTNGLEFWVYNWDENNPFLKLDFSDFEDSNTNFKKLSKLLAKSNLGKNTEGYSGDIIKFTKNNLSEVNQAFSWCHQHIYRKDNISQSEAFSEFVKLISLKLLSDRKIKEEFPGVLAEDYFEIPAKKVKFSTHWIQSQKGNTVNPIDNIQFQQFINEMEREIAKGERKRIFEKEDHIRLKEETILGVVKKLESIYLFGIDADLNGRLFETFLNATMRGKDLGQYFTPRSVVKLGVKLCQIKVLSNKHGIAHTDTIMDACCGTGGFLIDVLADMWKKVDEKTNLSNSDKDLVKKSIANNNLIGIDISSGPNLSRVARLNMYLHGDGGTRIFHTDALDKELLEFDTDSNELVMEKRQLRSILQDQNLVDIVLTNPPFAKVYERETENEKRILGSYEIGKGEGGVLRNSIKSSLLFIERYYDILKPGGKLVTIIDDGILSGKDYGWFRNYIRSRFLIKAVISMPGDAFQRSKARVKTSYLIAEKRTTEQQEQPPVFMYPCKFVGVDDSARQRTLPIDAMNREKAREEIQVLVDEYEKFQNGNGNSKYIVDASRIEDRMDVKNCLMKIGRSVSLWKRKGYNIFPIQEVLEEKKFSDDDIIFTKDCDDFVTLLLVRYSGLAEAGEEIVASDTTYSKLYRVRSGDLVISNIAASYGSMAVVPLELDGCVVSNEYTILRTKKGFHPNIVQIILRSPEIRSDILLGSTGANRTRMKWDLIKNISIPYPDGQLEKKILGLIDKAEEAKKLAQRTAEESVFTLENSFNLNNTQALDVIAAFKPPK
ncbi:N-6 DNA methylase [Lacibacter sediminis]|uniref:N-6 DNA methylase n=1 Tax=Lacibacter sediminis TaxID=2760713 RepID=A0A7G5XDZ5_9BACT|nr:N-6 DNA methylase [Lacibacter sediminis]QNA43698.1 N-6 DNA methylase [Lacibacter sediminis]